MSGDTFDEEMGFESVKPVPTIEEIQREADIKALMDEPYGRRFMWALLGDTGVFRSSFSLSAPDATAFKEGQRNVGLRYLTDILALCPEKYEEMTKENTRRDPDANR